MVCVRDVLFLVRKVFGDAHRVERTPHEEHGQQEEEYKSSALDQRVQFDGQFDREQSEQGG